MFFVSIYARVSLTSNSSRGLMEAELSLLNYTQKKTELYTKKVEVNTKKERQILYKLCMLHLKVSREIVCMRFSTRRHMYTPIFLYLMLIQTNKKIQPKHIKSLGTQYGKERNVRPQILLSNTGRS